MRINSCFRVAVANPGRKYSYYESTISSTQPNALKLKTVCDDNAVRSYSSSVPSCDNFCASAHLTVLDFPLGNSALRCLAEKAVKPLDQTLFSTACRTQTAHISLIPPSDHSVPPMSLHSSINTQGQQIHRLSCILHLTLHFRKTL